MKRKPRFAAAVLALGLMIGPFPEAVAQSETAPSIDGEAAIQAVVPITFNECVAGHTDPTKEYWYQNKYNLCRNRPVKIDYLRVVVGQAPQLIGSTYFRLTMLGLAQDRLNQISFVLRLVFDHDEGDVSYKAATSLTMNLNCFNIVDQQRAGACQNSLGPVTKTVAQWQADNGNVPVTYGITGTSTFVPAGDKYAAEKRALFGFELVGTTRAPSGWISEKKLPPESFRCDEATYVYGSKCVFTSVDSVFMLDANDPTYGESARFIRDAQTNITATKPGTSGTRVPGVLGKTDPLHRLFSQYDVRTSSRAANRIEASRRKIRRTCRKEFGVNYAVPVPPLRPKQCDEYPFATTYENASLANSNAGYSFAVRAITDTHNEKAGNLYGIWLGNDHILDGDPFYVLIR
jgi:hypothetical protein